MTRITPAEYAATVEKIAKVNERAAKRGFTGRFTLEAQAVTTTVTDQFGFSRTERFFDVEVSGEAPRYNGWTFLAALDNDPHAGLITRVAPGAETLVDRSAIVAGHCDHCGTERYRRNTYVVLNAETGEQKQVGSSCMKDFLGWDGKVVFLSEDEAREDIEGGWGLGGERSFGTDYVLAVAWACIKAFGFVPASAYSGTPTKNLVAMVLDPRGKDEREVADQIRPYVAEAAAHAAKVRAFILSEDFSGSSEYVINLKAVAAAEFTSPRNIGLLASAPQALARFEERSLIAKAKDEKPSEHFGVKGDKVEFTGTIETIRYIESMYGTSVLYQIRNAETGQIVKWFASREALGEETGVEVTITGTIKDHEEFRGVKSTVLTRCKEVVAKEYCSNGDKRVVDVTAKAYGHDLCKKCWQAHLGA